MMIPLVVIITFVGVIAAAAALAFPSRKPIRIPNRSGHSLDMISEKTRNFFSKVDSRQSTVAGGAGGSTSFDGFQRLDDSWRTLKAGGWQREPPRIVFDNHSSDIVDLRQDNNDAVVDDFDVIVSGGTLGIFYAMSLQKKGWRTCVVERGKVSGRAQEWNISRKELKILLQMGILTNEELNSIIGIEFNPNRVGFHTDTSANAAADDGFDLYTTDVLNVGVKPDILIDIVRHKYIASGGVLIEGAALTKIDLYQNRAVIYASESRPLSTRLVIDAMGNQSPIARQARGPVEPDGVCIVVGTCSRGFDPSNNTYSDVIYTDTPITVKENSQLQYFWEAFPAGSGPTDRTTYLFTYMDAKPDRPSIGEIMDDYWELLPRYQGIGPDRLEILRILYGCFPTYRDSPLKSTFARIMQVGDASGIQSPLSFGGFGSLTRHIERVTGALDEALRDDLLDSEHLSMVNAYQPNLSACWMMQRAMSVPVGKKPPKDLVVKILKGSFEAMQSLGDAVTKPFLQDVVQFFPFVRTLATSAAKDPITPLMIVPVVGPVAMIDFAVHMSNLLLFTVLYQALGPVLRSYAGTLQSPGARFKVLRLVEQWQFGSGLDYHDHDDE